MAEIFIVQERGHLVLGKVRLRLGDQRNNKALNLLPSFLIVPGGRVKKGQDKNGMNGECDGLSKEQQGDRA